MKTASVTELKANLSSYLRMVRRGSEVQILERGVPIARLVKWRALKVFWYLYPLLVVFVIVVTANHFIADAVLGAAAAGIGALVARAMARARPHVWCFEPARVQPAPATAAS